MNKIKGIIFFSIMLFFTSCLVSNKASKSGIKKFNAEDFPIIRTKFFVYHSAENTSQVYFKINASSLLYARPNQEGRFVAKIKLSFKLFDSYSSKSIKDSSSFLVLDTLFDKRPDFIEGKFTFNCNYGKKQEMEITINDINRKSSFPFFISIQKENKVQRQNFFVSKSNNLSSPIYNNLVSQNETYLVHYDKDSSIKNVQVRYYKREFGLPLPPFSTQEPKPFNYEADSVFYLKFDDNFNTSIHIKGNGFYHFITDSTSKEGLTLFCYNDYFPENNSESLMLKPLRYITTKQEFLDLENSTNTKEAIENYWLKASGNKERAKQLIKLFYNRTALSNEFFSSYEMGWKSDRGLIYIVFGPPTNIYRDNLSEVWVYGEENTARSINFTFVKVVNPFTDNDYLLTRSEVYKDTWYRIVEGWRQGRVMNEK